jgi:N-acetyl-1-D-myo-inositol-2-amino-2-deoxy-alpha-D-glucopyranoside deacetylase
MDGTAPRRQQRFIDADPREAIGALVAVIRDLRPHVVVTYDPAGGYGHPDHIHAHEVTMAAVAAAGTSDYPGQPWTVPKVYWTVISKPAMGRAMDALEDVPENWTRVTIDEIPFGYPDSDIDAEIDATDHWPAKVAALRAHATQVTVAPDGRSCALSNNLALPVAGVEHYILVSGEPGDRDDRGRETDLLSGLNLQ